MRLHWKDRFGDMSRTRLLPRFINLPVNEPSKNHLAGWFFRFILYNYAEPYGNINSYLHMKKRCPCLTPLIIRK